MLVTRRRAIFAGASLILSAAVVAYVWFAWRAPEIFLGEKIAKASRTPSTPEAATTAAHNARIAVITLAGSVVVALGLLFTAVNYRLARHGQITDRFTKALERLGSPELYVRLGGVHALEHVMTESADYHADVVEVLLAFVRTKVPTLPAPGEGGAEEHWSHPPTPHFQEIDRPRRPAPDVQAALTAISNRPARPRLERGNIDLSILHLRGAVLKNGRLVSADFSGSDLTEVDLRGANISVANFHKATMRRAKVDGVNAEAASFSGSNLRGASFEGTTLRRSEFVYATLENTTFPAADLRFCSFDNVVATLCTFENANLRHAFLGGTIFRACDLRKTRFTSTLEAKPFAFSLHLVPIEGPRVFSEVEQPLIGWSLSAPPALTSDEYFGDLFPMSRIERVRLILRERVRRSRFVPLKYANPMDSLSATEVIKSAVEVVGSKGPEQPQPRASSKRN